MNYVENDNKYPLEHFLSCAEPLGLHSVAIFGGTGRGGGERMERGALKEEPSTSFGSATVFFFSFALF